MQELTDEWDAEGMEIRTEIPADLRVLADRELLNRITANLLGNSRKYGGREAVHVLISAAASGGMAEITFADDGPGVPPEQLPRLFDVFYRGDAARTAPGKGSGLGLAVVKKAIEEMGGSVRAENEETSGLRIMFTLPLAKEDSHAENSDR
jgi:signal transduction histidine kinase